MTLEDIKEGDEICIINFINAEVVEFVEFLSYNQFLCKFNEGFVIFNVSEICLDDDKIIMIKEYNKCKDALKELRSQIDTIENIRADLKNKIFSK